MPGFVDWFFDARDLRNSMKLGISTSSTAKIDSSGHNVHINLRTVRGSPPVVEMGRNLSISDIDECLRQTVAFLEFVAMAVAQRRLPSETK